MNATATKLANLGTTGLVQFVNTGSLRLRGTRLAKAIKVVEARYGHKARPVFCEAVSRDFTKA
jgi:TolB-like protein